MVSGKGVRMRLASITIKNYRALDDITISLNDHMNVIYGENGVGKSSILYLIHDFLNLLTHKDATDVGHNIFPSLRIRDKKQPTLIRLLFEDGCAVEGKVFPDKPFLQIETIDKHASEGAPVLLDHVFPNLSFTSFIPNIINRPKIETKQVDGKLEFVVHELPKVAYTRGFNYFEFKASFEELENLENQKKLAQITDQNIPVEKSYCNPTLEKIRNAIPKIADHLHGLTIDRQQLGNPLCVEKYGRLINIEDQLSSGEASVVALVGQIALDLSEVSSQNHIVIIDEVDNSLHPQWQMKICHVLQEIFPEVQFIMSSHSPFVWAGLEKDEIIWLEKDELGKTIHRPAAFAKGGSVESIIAHFFNTKSYDDEAAVAIKQVDEYINKKQKNEATQEIERLRERFGDLPILERLEFRMRMMGL